MILFISLTVLVAGCTTPSTNPNPNGGTNLAETVEVGDTVAVNYKGTLTNGQEFDSSLQPGRTPLEFTVGDGNMIAGFDDAVRGMKLNEEKTVTLPPEKAYGFEQPDLIVQVPREMLSGVPEEQLVVGTELRGPMGRGVITKVDTNNVTINFNHELAGQTLVFWIKVVEIKKK